MTKGLTHEDVQTHAILALSGIQIDGLILGKVSAQVSDH